MSVAIGMPGLSEWLVILVIVLIFFGVGKLPKVLSQMGKGVKAFKDGVEGKEGEGEGEDAPRREIDVTPAEEIASEAVEKSETRV